MTKRTSISHPQTKWSASRPEDGTLIVATSQEPLTTPEVSSGPIYAGLIVDPDLSDTEITKTAPPSDAGLVLLIRDNILNFKQELNRLIIMDMATPGTRLIFESLLYKYWFNVYVKIPTTLKGWNLNHKKCATEVAFKLAKYTRTICYAMRDIKSKRAKRMVLIQLKRSIYSKYGLLRYDTRFDD